MWNEVGRLADEGVRLSTRLAENSMLLTIAVTYAWADAWDRSCRRTGSAFDADLRQRARTLRLIRRGVPLATAARNLYLL